jgi:hypothetical protein
VVKGVKECARPPGPKHDSPRQLAAPAREPDHVTVGEHSVTAGERGVTAGERNVSLGEANVTVGGAGSSPPTYAHPSSWRRASSMPK